MTDEKVVPFPQRGAKPPADEDLAQLFAARMRSHWRYVPDWQRVMLFDDVVWVRDELNRYDYEARVFIEEIAEPLKGKARDRMLGARTYKAIARMTYCDPQLTLAVDDWDAAPMSINLDGELLDLGTGDSRTLMATDYVTKTTRVKPGSECSLWLEFLELVTGGDTDLMEYLQRMAGYCLTGSTKEQVLFFLWGPGGNGKSTFVNTIAAILGNYAVNAPMDMLAVGNNERHPTELARLQGARLVTASETDLGRRWDEPKLKQLTGGDVISARFMNQNFFDYRPAFKLMISGNYKPELRGIDDAIKRRVRIVPFVVKIPEAQRVLDFEERLKPEWSGILSWMIRGARYWREQGLQTPAAVLEATAEYFEQEDTVGTWLEESTTIDKDRFESSTSLFQSWAEWTKRTGEWTGKAKGLTAALKKRPELRWHRTNRTRGFYGRRIISLTEQDLWSHNT